jgi:hypothetical protein
MRTKVVEGILRLDVVRVDPPKPSLYVAYDGLVGISQRPILKDVLEELDRMGNETAQAFLRAAVRCRHAEFCVYFSDYVSYGIGGGDAVAEFFYKTLELYTVDAKNPDRDGSVEPALVLVREDGRRERIPIRVN